MRRYYLHDGISQKGPFTIDELKAQRISKKTPVWFEGITDWTPAEKIPELLDLITIPPPLFKSAPTTIFPPAYNEPKSRIPSLQHEQAYKQTQAETKKVSRNLIVLVAAICLVIFISCLVYFNKTKSDSPSASDPKTLPIDSMGLTDVDKRAQEEERRRINEELTRKNTNFRNNWEEYIKVTNSDYKASSLGGIYGLKIIVLNNTDYLIDEISAEVLYRKASGEVWQTIYVPITNIPTHSRKTVSVEDVERSTSVEVSANTITSKKMHFYYSPEYSSGNPNDPYFFK